MAESLTTFTVTAAIVTVTPGLDTALVLRTSASEGTKSGISAGLGILLGLIAWGAIIAFGLGGLLGASQLAYSVLKWMGAAYLAWLGINLIRSPRKSIASSSDDVSDQNTNGWFLKGLLSNLLNPKIGVFYVTFLPQFVPQNVAISSWTFLLAVIHAGLTLTWFLVLIAATIPLGRALRKPKVLSALDRFTGVIFLAFGLKIALTRN